MAQADAKFGTHVDRGVLVDLSRFIRQLGDVVTTCAADARRSVADFIAPLVDRAPQRGRSTRRKSRAKAEYPATDAFAPIGFVVYAVGDIHGRADLLEKLIADIRNDVSETVSDAKPMLVFLGDYIDRGFQSKAVLDMLCGPGLSDFETRYLKGNHEAAMLQFISDPGFGVEWAKYGGVETLVSYGVRPPASRTEPAQWLQAREDLMSVLPESHLGFLHLLEPQVTLGDYEFVHAGVDPAKPLHAQTEQELLWIRSPFLKDRKRLERVIVHGHTPEPQPHHDYRRIGLDTGAYMSGMLSAVRLERNSVRFITT